jgi:hypothetical protein
MCLHLHQHACIFCGWISILIYIYIGISSILEHGLLLQVLPSLLVTFVCVYFFRFWEIHDLYILLISQETIVKKLWKVKENE